MIAKKVTINRFKMPEFSEENNNVKVKKLEPTDVVDLDGVDDDSKSGRDPASLTTSTDEAQRPSTPARNKKVKIDLKTSQIKSGDSTEKRNASLAELEAAQPEIQVKPPVHKVSPELKSKT